MRLDKQADNCRRRGKKVRGTLAGAAQVVATSAPLTEGYEERGVKRWYRFGWLSAWGGLARCVRCVRNYYSTLTP